MSYAPPLSYCGVQFVLSFLHSLMILALFSRNVNATTNDTQVLRFVISIQVHLVNFLLQSVRLLKDPDILIWTRNLQSDVKLVCISIM